MTYKVSSWTLSLYSLTHYTARRLLLVFELFPPMLDVVCVVVVVAREIRRLSHFVAVS